MKIVSQKYKPGDFSEGQWHETLVTLGKNGFSPQMADLVANSKSGKAKEIVKLMGGVNPYFALIEGWQKFYTDLGINADFSALVIPEKKDGFDRLIIEAAGLSPQKVYDICFGLFQCWKWTNESLDKVIIHSDRFGLHAVWVKETVEADENLKNLSANQLKKLGISGITFNERGLYEAKYFKETRKHLDISNWTLCSGSRDSDGDVPRVDRYDFSSKMRVSYASPSYATGLLRARAVLSL